MTELQGRKSSLAIVPQAAVTVLAPTLSEVQQAYVAKFSEKDRTSVQSHGQEPVKLESQQGLTTISLEPASTTLSPASRANSYYGMVSHIKSGFAC